MRAVGDTMIISPPLIMSEAEIDEMIATVVQGLDETYNATTN
jgi:putrescine aminotransferase